MDGSFHRRLEERAGEICLMHLVDDATSRALFEFGQDWQETTWAAVHVLRGWIERYGVPRALYTDCKSVYVRQPSERELREGTVARTQFGRMCEQFGIRIIAASSPQSVWSDRRRCADRGLGCEFRKKHSSEPQA